MAEINMDRGLTLRVRHLGFSVAVERDPPRAAAITGGLFKKLPEVIPAQEPFDSDTWMERLR